MTDKGTKTAEEWREESSKHSRRKMDSIERCDTDGFVSQWASGLSSQLARKKAEITENDGKDKFWGLYEGDRRVKAMMLDGKWGPYWLLHEDEEDLRAKRGKPFIPAGTKSRVQKNLGLSQRREWAPAWAKMDGRGTGLSGSAWVATFRSGDKWGGDATLLTEAECEEEGTDWYC